MSKLQVIESQFNLPRWQTTSRVIVGLIVAFIAWSTLTEIDEVTIAFGEIVPKGQVKVVQHLEGGIIEGLYVEDGTIVDNDQVLVQLNAQATSLNADEIAVRLDGLLLAHARLEAEATGDPLALPEEIVARRPDLADAETRNYESRQRQNESTLAVVAEQVRQRELEVREQEAALAAARNDLSLTSDAFTMQKKLEKDQLVSRLDLNQLERDFERLQGRVKTLEASMPRAEAGHEEAKIRQQNAVDRIRSDARGEQRDIAVDIARHRELLSKATDQAARTEIRAPINGIVKNLRFHTIGGVISPGEPIMEIVPLDDRLVVHGQIAPTDIGFVHPGQPATVKLTAYDFMRYGSLEGEVTQLGADADVDQNGQPFFRVVVETAASSLGGPDTALKVTPGMQAQIDIHTGTRSIMSFLIKPIARIRHEAFREH